MALFHPVFLIGTSSRGVRIEAPRHREDPKRMADHILNHASNADRHEGLRRLPIRPLMLLSLPRKKDYSTVLWLLSGSVGQNSDISNNSLNFCQFCDITLCNGALKKFPYFRG
jgi:hypothetical protein